MNYSTLDRFQGAWLGSIIGAGLDANINESDCGKTVQYKFADWVKDRDKIAQIILNNQSREYTTLQEILAEHCSNNFLDGVDGSSQTSQVSLINRKGNAIFLLLPLIMLQENLQEIEDLYVNLISRCSSNSFDATEARQEIVIWNYLITLALNNKLQLEESNVSMIIKQALGGAKAETTFSVANLKIVSQAWEKAWSLQQLADRLYKQDLENKARTTFSSAIALSLYCFISTPKNFMFSVKRACAMGGELAPIVTVLTASISGAWNGMSGIPNNWLAATSNNRDCQQAQNTVTKLFEIWLGIYNPDNLELLYNPEIYAVAIPKIFQSRQNLKIISQKSGLS